MGVAFEVTTSRKDVSTILDALAHLEVIVSSFESAELSEDMVQSHPIIVVRLTAVATLHDHPVEDIVARFGPDQLGLSWRMPGGRREGAKLKLDFDDDRDITFSTGLKCL